MSVLLFLGVIFVLVLVHEFGHFWTAKKTGMRVDEFGIGFPPKMASVQKGETEYSFNLFPIGGFVRIFGEDATDAADSPDRDRSFVAKSPMQQALVLIAGVTANMIFAWLLFVIVLAIGVPTVVDEVTASPEARLMVAEVLPDSPAAIAGLPAGAEITGLSAGVDEDMIGNITSFRAFTEDRNGVPIDVTYRLGDETGAVTITPETEIVPDDPDRPAVGVALSMIETVRQPIHSALWEGTKQTWSTLVAVTIGIGTLLADSVMLRADLSSVAGPVGIVGLVDQAATFGFTSLLLFTALISVNLAVINMLPFPALDGGRLLFVLVEVLKGSPIKPVWVMRLNTIGFFLLIALMVAVTWSDVSKLI